MEKIINGKEISQNIKDEIKLEIENLKKETGKIPGLAVILVGNDPASNVYVGSKEKTCLSLGFYSEKYVLPENASEDELLDKINELNKNVDIDGILVQLPLPKHINSDKILNSILPEKDVDGFHPINVGKLMIGADDGFFPCTPYGIIELLKRKNIKIDGKNAVIVGRSNIVGKPISLMLLKENATVTICHSRTKDLNSVVKGADIIVAAIGKAKFINKDMVKDGAIIIDVGINRIDGSTKLYGDVDYDSVFDKISYITPVPGGVGPMTIAMLMKNTLISFKRRVNKI
ncbi:MAG: bifunctional methylenetetrahydrofolate dehydrogenase/methenyltetrahydrofolate cyclohydrolase FolD [Fusobacteria bacterium]|nr:bifunctional methylenetetrahydrofolate dehydrogenase/methenyltetrahydrofolate cyclohydrolase FolD [Fusobacteriota bacterium]